MDIDKLSAIGKDMGLSGTKLRAWIEEQQASFAQSLVDIEERKKNRT